MPITDGEGMIFYSKDEVEKLTVATTNFLSEFYTDVVIEVLDADTAEKVLLAFLTKLPAASVDFARKMDKERLLG